MKQELRCHAVLCPSANKAKLMAERLRARLHQALVDFKKEKLWRQNARLSLANSVYDNPTMPQRKMLLNTGSMNYRPPLERGKAASKLKMIEEVSSEDDYNEGEERAVDVVSSSAAAADTMSVATSFTTLSDAVSLASTVIDHPPPSGDVSSVPAGQQQSKRTLILPDPVRQLRPDDSSDEDDEDEITNHLNDLSIEDEEAKDSVETTTVEGGTAASAAAAALPNNAVELSELVQRSKVTEDPDTISDESGYSEESNATLSSAGGAKHTAAVPVPTVPPDNMPHDFEESPPTPLADGAVDLSVKGVLISDFSNSEQLRYLERRSRSRSVSPFSSGQIQPDFCINI